LEVSEDLDSPDQVSIHLKYIKSHDIWTALNFTENRARAMLEIKDIIIMYEMCRFEKAWYPDSVSVWCAVFDEADLKVLKKAINLKNPTQLLLCFL